MVDRCKSQCFAGPYVKPKPLQHLPWAGSKGNLRGPPNFPQTNQGLSPFSPLVPLKYRAPVRARAKMALGCEKPSRLKPSSTRCTAPATKRALTRGARWSAVEGQGNGARLLELLPCSACSDDALFVCCNSMMAKKSLRESLANLELNCSTEVVPVSCCSGCRWLSCHAWT